MDALEVYVLSGERGSECASRFLTEFAPSRSPVATDFPYPEFVDDPTVIYDNPNELIRRLERDGNQPYAIYWNVEVGGLSDQVMIFFTEDNGMIVGLGGPHMQPEIALSLIQRVVNGKYGYITSCSCPPSSINAFISMCIESTLPNIFEGVLRIPRRID